MNLPAKVDGVFIVGPYSYLAYRDNTYNLTLPVKGAKNEYDEMARITIPQELRDKAREMTAEDPSLFSYYLNSMLLGGFEKSSKLYERLNKFKIDPTSAYIGAKYFKNKGGIELLESLNE